MAAAIKGLKERGFESPYLRAFVVARINPLRFQRGAKADFDETIDKMLASARRFDAGKIKADQVARASGPPEEAIGLRQALGSGERSPAARAMPPSDR